MLVIDGPCLPTTVADFHIALALNAGFFPPDPARDLLSVLDLSLAELDLLIGDRNLTCSLLLHDLFRSEGAVHEAPNRAADPGSPARAHH